MKASELHQKDADALQALLIDLQRDAFKLRMQKGSDQLTATHQIKQLRRDIARVKTILTEKAASQAQTGDA